MPSVAKRPENSLKRRSLRGVTAERKRMWRLQRAKPLRSVQYELRIREIGQMRPVRTLEVFPSAPLGINTYQAGNRLVGIDDHGDLAEPEQEAADAAGAGDIFGGVAAVDQLHRGWCDEAAADADRLQNEREGA